MKLSWILLFVVLAFSQVYGQSDTVTIQLHGKVKDLATSKAIPGVNISVMGSKQGTSTLANGHFSVTLTFPRDSFPLKLVFSHVSFDDHYTSIGTNFNRSLEVKMVPKIQNMKVVEIYSGPFRVASPYFSQILDYEVYNNNIVLLEKLDKSRKNRVRIVDFNGNLLGETIVKGKAISLFKDCREEVYLIMQDRYLKIHHDIEVSVSVSTQNLENRIKNPCRILTDSFLIYEEYGYARLMSWFFKHKNYDRYSTLFYFSADRQTMRLIQEDLLALREKYGNIIQDLMYLEASLDNTEENRVRNLVLDEDLSQSLFYKPNYCPLFLNGDEIIAFDHGHNQIVKMSAQGKILSKKKIKYHHKLAWEPQVFQDPSNSMYFTLMKRSAFQTLYKIDPNTGLISSFHKIENPFPEKIKLHNGYLMYLYRQPRTPDRYSLYLERY